MKYGTVCTGIGAPEVAWKKLGWKCVFQSEIEPFPCKVLKHHFPGVPNLGDMTKLLTNKKFNGSTFDVLCGGTPCQSFSLAGLRGGMADERGNLALVFCKLLLAKQPKWFLWENVPGVFSSYTDETGSQKIHNGIDGTESVSQSSDFATLLQGFQECGYSCAWRVLDSQHFGVPQRRRRVFVVGYLGKDWRPPFAVLFERHSLQGDITPSDKTRKEVAGTIEASSGRSRGAGINPDLITPYRMTAFGEYEDDNTAGPIKKRDYKDPTDLVCASYDCRNDVLNHEISATIQSNDAGGTSINKINPVIYDTTQITSKQNGSNPKPEICHALAKGQHVPLLVEEDLNDRVVGTLSPGAHPGALNGQDAYTGNYAFHKGEHDPLIMQDREGKEGGGKGLLMSDRSFSLRSSTKQALFSNYSIRRLTPLECERLQGFPDNWTNIPGATDTPRYASLGNSMTTNVIEWIGSRIEKVDKILKKQN